MSQARSLDLAGKWQLTWSEGMHGRDDQQRHPAADPGRWVQVDLPGEWHRELEKLGWVEDPNLGLNSLKQRWIEEQMWFCRRSFQVDAKAAGEPAWLVFEQLDLNAVIMLNGEEIGRHANAHRPCRIEVTGKLKAGANEVSLSLESGLYATADKTKAYSGDLAARLNKRPWLRKAQYQFGWDWSPRLINVGITGALRLEWGPQRIEQAQVTAQPMADGKGALVRARVWLRNGESKSVRRSLSLKVGGQEVRLEAGLAPGLSQQQLELTLPEARLWWPRGHGEQPLYDVEVQLRDGQELMDSKQSRIGVRTVTLKQEPHPVSGKYFILQINGRDIFCKGGNWVPPDLLASQVEPGRLRRLVDLALESNFNLLRIWGGGHYAGHELLELCDELGLLVWQDLPFACASYPADDAAFMRELYDETLYAVREFSGHASLAVWCGNNELEQGYHWSYKAGEPWGAWDKTLVDHGLFHLAIPMLLIQEDPGRPYWPSSPYSGASHIDSNEPTLGDQHPWGVSLGPEGPDFWAYRSRVDRFPNEGGVLGASGPATLKQALGAQFAFRSPAWEHHDNAVNFWGSGPGVCYQATEFWLGREAAKLPLEDYLYASGLLQAEGLTEYIQNYRRRMFSSAAAVFWMYNDAWPATHGWTTVDYYLRKKLAFHPVRRAFAPLSVVVAEEGAQLKVFGVNDGPAEQSCRLDAGLFKMAGGLEQRVEKDVLLKANASTLLAEIPRAALEKLGLAAAGAYARLSRDGQVISQDRLFLERFKNLKWSPPKVDLKLEKGQAVFSSPVFVWGLALDLDGDAALADNLFDLLPGLPYAIPWDSAEAPKILKSGNTFFGA